MIQILLICTNFQANQWVFSSQRLKCNRSSNFKCGQLISLIQQHFVFIVSKNIHLFVCRELNLRAKPNDKLLASWPQHSLMNNCWTFPSIVNNSRKHGGGTLGHKLQCSAALPGTFTIKYVLELIWWFGFHEHSRFRISSVCARILHKIWPNLCLKRHSMPKETPKDVLLLIWISYRDLIFQRVLCLR